jgi:hypothetical protein
MRQARDQDVPKIVVILADGHLQLRLFWVHGTDLFR